MNPLVLSIIFFVGALIAFIACATIGSGNDTKRLPLPDGDSGLEKQVNSLKSELEKSRQDQWAVKGELEFLKKKEADLNKDLNRLKEENARLKDELREKTSAPEPQGEPQEDPKPPIEGPNQDSQIKPLDSSNDWP